MNPIAPIALILLSLTFFGCSRYADPYFKQIEWETGDEANKLVPKESWAQKAELNRLHSQVYKINFILLNLREDLQPERVKELEDLKYDLASIHGQYEVLFDDVRFEYSDDKDYTTGKIEKSLNIKEPEVRKFYEFQKAQFYKQFEKDKDALDTLHAKYKERHAVFKEKLKQLE